MKKGHTTTDMTEIQRIMRNYYKYTPTNLITKNKSVYYQKHKPMKIKS